MLVTIIILSVAALMLLQGKFSHYEILLDKNGRLVGESDENDQPSADRDTVGVLKNKIPVPDARPFLVPVLDVETLTTKDTLKSKES
jgi:hypothetical protein